MKNKIIITLILTLIFSLSSFSQAWLNSLKDAKKIALVSNKLILIDFTASWFAPCRKMESNVWSNKETQLLMDNFVSVKIDVDYNKEIAREYDITSIPNIFILDGNGKVIENFKGYKKKFEIDKILKNYCLNTSFVQNKLISFYKKPSYISALRLGNEYQIYSLYLDSKLKSKFLNLASKYFDISSKFLKKNKVKNKKMLIQKIELLKLR